MRLAADADLVVVTNHADKLGLEGGAAPGLSSALRVVPPRRPRPSPHVIPIGSNIPVAPPPGYTPAAWRAALGIPPDALLVAYFGLLSSSKGADLLVEALASLTRPWRLLLIGGSATAPQDVAHAEAVRARIAALGHVHHVIATGHVSPAEVSAHLLAADMVALPYRDGASFRRGSLLAALAHGRPVVTTAPASPDDESLLSSAARLVPPDAAALAQALLRLADDSAERARLGAAGQALAARFSWESIAGQHERLYTICSTSQRKL
jgi:glycosyltransferase involved in cell wall biosynthesis